MFARVKRDLKKILKFFFTAEVDIPIGTYSSKIFLNKPNHPDRVTTFEGDSSDQDGMTYSNDLPTKKDIQQLPKEFMGYKVKKLNKLPNLSYNTDNLGEDSLITLTIGPNADLSWEQYDTIVKAAKLMKQDGRLTNEMIRKASPRGKARSNADLAAGFMVLAVSEAVESLELAGYKILKVDSRKRINLGKLVQGFDKVAIAKLDNGKLELTPFKIKEHA